tara:strand:- start:376 stop:690 length:315 start_codon:yes stop_codon:yes gene_type:complete
MAFDINTKNSIDSKTIKNAIELLYFNLKNKQKLKEIFLNKKYSSTENINNRGTIILQTLALTSGGIDTNSEDLYKALSNLKRINEIDLLKSILTEYLVHYSETR